MCKRNKEKRGSRRLVARATWPVPLVAFPEGMVREVELETEQLVALRISIMNSMTIQLGRFAQLTNDVVQSSRDLLLLVYEPQGVEHSFCLKVTCLMDKQGSAPPARC